MEVLMLVIWKLCFFVYGRQDLLWMAPEQLREESGTSVGTQNGDIYSAAIIQHEMFFRTVPYGYPDMEADEIIEKVRANEPLFRPKV
ncbi:unnamed protein product [Dibothriocephalus latus]|uniref:Uncharacterized protein n=1 Tax=Dibothriocephalus latus TaxID=60516 RepID=A0A3P7NZH2_DIBLA|nr:unnamed protein product [Dibothriocephalus latus]